MPFIISSSLFLVNSSNCYLHMPHEYWTMSAAMNPDIQTPNILLFKLDIAISPHKYIARSSVSTLSKL